jgi:uncharacterized protein YvpB
MRFRGALVLLLSAFVVMASCGLSARHAAAHTVGDSSAFVEVPAYVQQRNLSCEYASLVISMATYGTWVDEWVFDEMVPLSDNPHWGFRGDINGAWGNTTDYGVYPEALVEPLAQLGFRGVAFYGQGDDTALRTYLNNGVPVVVWLGIWGDQSHYEFASDGTPYKLNAGNHVVVAYGYDESGVYAIDPANGSTVSWTWGDFMWMWNVLDGMSLATWPLVGSASDDNTAIETPSLEPAAIETTAVDFAVDDNPAVCC